MKLVDLSVAEIKMKLEETGYFGNTEIAIAVKNACILHKPILVEGPPGVGKTELAKAIGKMLNQELIRLQCSPEINERKAIYDFDYPKQLLFIQMLKEDIFIGDTLSLEEKIKSLHQNNPFYSEEFMVKRPLLKAFYPEDNREKVLLIDELDKADEEFEYSLLEPFSDYTISIPEIGTLEATHKPITIVTSNRRRTLTDTFSRRCLYVYIDYPSIEEETNIIVSKTNASPELSQKVAEAVSKIRDLRLSHTPSIAESIEWATVLSVHLENREVSDDSFLETISVIAKTPSDREKIKQSLLFSEKVR